MSELSVSSNDTFWSDSFDVDPYYFTNITFEVDGTLFRVPKHHFMTQSDVFRDMFEVSGEKDTHADGSSDEHPLRLEGVSRMDFVQLLRAMFPSRPLVAEIFSVPELTSILGLCALWQMNQLAKSVLKALSTVPCGQSNWIELLDLSRERQLPEAETLALRKIDEARSEMVSRVNDWLRHGQSEWSKAKASCTPLGSSSSTVFTLWTGDLRGYCRNRIGRRTRIERRGRTQDEQNEMKIPLSVVNSLLRR